MSTFSHFSFLKIAASENLTQSDLEPRIFNIFSTFLMLRKALISVSNVESKPLPFNFSNILEFRGILL